MPTPATRSSWLTALQQAVTPSSEALPPLPPRPAVPPPPDPTDRTRYIPPGQWDTTRVHLPDPRPLDETEKMKGYYATSNMRDVLQNALERDVDPYLASAVAVQEGFLPVAQTPTAPMRQKRAEFDAHSDVWNAPARPEFARNLRAHAARLPDAPLPDQLRAWNGTGDSTLPRAYGKAKGERSPTEFPDRVLGIRDNITSKSPEIAALISQIRKQPFVVKPPEGTPDDYRPAGSVTWDDEVAFAIDDLTRKTKYPNLLRDR